MVSGSIRQNLSVSNSIRYCQAGQQEESVESIHWVGESSVKTDYIARLGLSQVSQSEPSVVIRTIAGHLYDVF